MKRKPQRRMAPLLSLPVCLVAAGTVLLPSLSFAQMSTTPSAGGLSPVNRRTVAPAPPKPAPPPALPGAQSGLGAPATRIPTDLPPNEAMFDGVNRGDIGAVRDALSRGADINAHNILGITATELAVDLGRNDIAFLLLSMRGAETPRGSRGSASAQAAAVAQPRAAPAPRQTQAVRPAATQRTGEPPAPRLFAQDGGTPVPTAGFLGFDGMRVTR